MFGVLLESRARRQPRTGGAALSVAAHVAIIGIAGATTMHGRPAAAKRVSDAVPVQFVTPPRPTPLDVPAMPRSSAQAWSIPAMRDVHIAPINLQGPPPIGPVVDFSDAVNANACLGCDGATSVSSVYFATRPPKTPVADEWRGTELLMRILKPAVPRYPEALRSAGVEGTVLVQFTVDTTGGVDMSSLKILSSTHDLFTAAVRDALVRLRLKPAEVDGHRVPALAQMPFEFRLTK